MFYTLLNAALCAAVVAYFFYPLAAGLFFGLLWLLIPPRRSDIALLFHLFVGSDPEAQMLPGALPVFILTFVWLFVIWILR